jgi:hypothetical protein
MILPFALRDRRSSEHPQSIGRASEIKRWPEQHGADFSNADSRDLAVFRRLLLALHVGSAARLVGHFTRRAVITPVVTGKGI